MKQINGKLETMFFEIVQDKFKLYDSNQEYVGYVEVATDFLHAEEIALLPLQLAQMEHVSKIVDLGFCYNMMFSDTNKDVVIRNLIDFALEEEYITDEKEFEEIEIDVNQIGNNYFIVDYAEYL